MIIKPFIYYRPLFVLSKRCMSCLFHNIYSPFCFSLLSTPLLVSYSLRFVFLIFYSPLLSPTGCLPLSPYIISHLFISFLLFVLPPPVSPYYIFNCFLLFVLFTLSFTAYLVCLLLALHILHLPSCLPCLLSPHIS